MVMYCPTYTCGLRLQAAGTVELQVEGGDHQRVGTLRAVPLLEAADGEAVQALGDGGGAKINEFILFCSQLFVPLRLESVFSHFKQHH